MINASSTLFRYLSRQFLTHLFFLMLILMGVIFLFDSIELLRRAANLPHSIPFSLIFSMALLKLAYLTQRVLPMGVLFASIYTCWKLNKTSEIIVIRSTGLSAWQFLSPLLLCAMLIGMVSTTALNPMSSIFLSKYEQMDNVYFNNNSNLVTVSKTGIWLRQPSEQGYALLHSESFDQKEWQLNNVTILFFGDDDSFQQRMDSPTAFLKKGYWDVRAAAINDKAGLRRVDSLQIPTELTATKIEESFADPDTISFWNIPEYAKIMAETGLPVTRLSIHFNVLLAQPLLFAALVLLAATFSLRPPRFGGTAALILLGVGVGFLIFFMESMLQAFGTSQKIPVYLAAWTPAVIALLLGITALLHLEDG